MAVILIPITVGATLLSNEHREMVLAGGATLSFISFVLGV